MGLGKIQHGKWQLVTMTSNGTPKEIVMAIHHMSSSFITSIDTTKQEGVR
jgi:hypothetical protein